jgi:hypothetical protein
MTPDNALTHRNYIRSQLDQTLARRVCDPEDETLRQQMEALIRQLAAAQRQWSESFRRGDPAHARR